MSGYGETFLPNLRKISFVGVSFRSDSPHFLPVFPLIPSTLENLNFGPTTPLGPETALSMLQTFTRASVEHLKSIDLGATSPTSQDLRSAITTFLQHQKRLEYLGLSRLALSTEDVRNIGYLPRLTLLSLNHSGDRGQDLAEACAAIGDQFPNLQKFSLINEARMETDISVLEGLGPCRDLRAVTIICRRPRSATAKTIQSLGRSWPRLEELHFKSSYHPAFTDDYRPNEYSGTPIAVLEDVALCWSETITTVSLILNTRSGVPKASEVKGRFKKLRQITVEQSTVHEHQVRPVAEFIAAMCTTPPSIKRYRWEEAQGDWYTVGTEMTAIIERRQT